YDNSYDAFTGIIESNYSTIVPGALYMDSPNTIAYRADDPDDIGEANVYDGPMMMNMYNNFIANGSVTISAYYSPFQYAFNSSSGNSLQFIVYFCLAMSVFPALCSLYPTMERLRLVRALHYSNGLRVLPLWISHICFDFSVVLFASGITIAIFSGINSEWFGLGYLFVVFALYGLASILLSYVFSLIVKSQLAAFAFTAAFNACYFLIYLLAYLSIDTFVSATKVDQVLINFNYGFAPFAPIANLIRSMFLVLNLFNALCEDTVEVSYYGEMRAYGAPILYLSIQIMLLFGGLIWWDSGKYRIRMRRKFHVSDAERELEAEDEDLTAEVTRVENPDGGDGLRAVHVSKRFGRMVAVEDVSFGVARGECFALLGPNGAGKSTLFNMMRGELVPSGGAVYVEDVDVAKNRAHARTHLGVCPQFDAIDRMTVYETLSFYARLRGLPKEDLGHNVESIITGVGLSRFRTRLAGDLSGGNRRKLSLGIALMADPSVLLLDEPSSGMDAASKRVMWRMIKRVAAAGNRSIILTTHSMEEADALCLRAGILAKVLLAVGTSDRLRERHGHAFYVHFMCRDGIGASEESMQAVVTWSRERFVGHTVQVEDKMYHGNVKVSVESRGEDGAVLTIVNILQAVEEEKERIGISHYSVAQASLEQVFLNIVTKHNILEEGY
ncbi:P-loop containing nucleoside triphosphate hydrolase protein, partial [Limtongia smithiae]|uniref:P-loop containing nucleoside triphosphate hydrolase protein n=1 Tax=Limtongia smithiae TaxID=1125753 RepID=UPI0034CDD488